VIVPDNLKYGAISAFFTERAEGIDGKVPGRISGYPETDIFSPLQRHTDTIINLDLSRDKTIADGVITSRKGVLLGISTADCVPILIYDPQKQVVGAVHAGWRGTSKGILKKALHSMSGAFGSMPANTLIALGPAIRWCCYDVGKDVLESVTDATGEGEYSITKNGKICLDLPSANMLQAIALGVPEENIWISKDCTYCCPERFFSYRFSKTGGRQGAFIGIKSK